MTGDEEKCPVQVVQASMDVHGSTFLDRTFPSRRPSKHASQQNMTAIH